MITFVVVLFVALVLIGMPIAFILGVIPMAFWLVTGGSIPSIIFPQKMFSGISNFVLMAIPFFILAGNLMNSGGVTRRIIDFTQSIVGWVRGGLGVVNVVASMIFGGISGSANADVAAFGTALIPAMEESGYDKEFSTAITVTSSTVGPIIPPSISMVVYASLANVSVGALFLGGVIPGFLIGLFLTILVLIVAHIKHYPKDSAFSIRKVFSSFAHAIPALIMPLIILGGVLMGVCTPTEAAAIAVVYAFVVGLFVFRELTLESIGKILLDTLTLSAAIFMVIAFTNVVSYIIADIRIPQLLGDFLTSVSGDNKYIILLLINIILLCMGALLDPSAGLILLTPILVPIAQRLGIDLVHLGVIMVLNLTIGLTTPPVGTCLYIGSTISGLPVPRLFKAMLPYLISNIIVLLIVTYVPETVIFLAALV
ncbi:TRAP transporter large permease [Oscillibacter valericigenes]|uniref:TRAP transporter large permease n=1 Tax=Oscillibacter valericigenes TaxID=351091 RepID=UPI001F2BD998|nr:TRAP transporter large permease [Oscillibacter valericigenes]MCF2665191.1 TRAP transporter large permease [Oscillibacter valericigenes]